MSLYTLPFLYLNLGGEMLYILQQRLGAEKIQNQRQKKAMQDIIKHMLNDNVQSSLFTAQPLSTQKRLKANFTKLANASVININETSMEKLFDLMLMTVKYQLLLCKSGHELLLITLNHLDAMRETVKDNDHLMTMVNKTCSGLVDCFHSFSEAQLMLIRHTLLVFLQDCDRKISLFLSKGLQLPDGVLVIPHNGNVPYGVQPPGMIHYLSGDHRVDRVTLYCRYEGMEKRGCLDVTGDRVITTGENLYYKKPSAKATSTPPTLNKSPLPKLTRTTKKQDNPTIAELDFLQNLLIGHQHAPSDTDFKLILFDTPLDEDMSATTTPVSKPSLSTDSSTVNITTTGAGSKSHLKNILIDFDKESTTTNNKSGGDDLLSLMDNL